MRDQLPFIISVAADNYCCKSILLQGYEVFSPNINNGDGSFCIVFHQMLHALEWCIETQQLLLEEEWPDAICAHPAAAEELGNTSDNRCTLHLSNGSYLRIKRLMYLLLRLLFRGLRVRMGVHFGRPNASKDRLTGRTEFSGPVVQHAATITSIAHGGQVPLASCMFMICLAYLCAL